MRAFSFIAFLTCLLAGSVALSNAQDISPRAQKLHKRAIVVDTHIDVTQRMLFEKEFDLAKRDAKGHTDIPRMKEGGLDAIFFSIYMAGTVTGPEAVKRSLRLIDSVLEAVRANPNDLVLATTAAEIRKAKKQHKIAALMGMEGGHMIDDDLRLLRMYAALGVRYLTLTHGVSTNWADSSTGEPKNNGLSDFGKDAIRELNRLGVMVDVSHISDKTFYDVLEVTKAPVIASHSSCRAICNVPRNMTDDMLRALAKNGGVVQINYHIGFLSQEYADASAARRDEQRANIAEIQKQYANDDARRREEIDRLRRESAASMPKVTLDKVIEHIDHAVKIAGVDHVGLGSDFDGATMPVGMEDVSKLPRITEALLKKGYSEKDIEKILGGNLLRVMEQNERNTRVMGHM
ncbi:MAG: dipeptidase [Acidobacteria bacterium]|nr:dipeptidase [Acidobacteriota bacterium]MCL5288459.1 dipeptidase [Acidobacteriota bacterium]